jgi:hypothetical protein
LAVKRNEVLILATTKKPDTKGHILYDPVIFGVTYINS